MVDEIFDRDYQSARNALNRSLGDGMAKLGRAIVDAFEVLNRIEFQAPWAARTQRARAR